MYIVKRNLVKLFRVFAKYWSRDNMKRDPRSTSLKKVVDLDVQMLIFAILERPRTLELVFTKCLWWIEKISILYCVIFDRDVASSII